MAHWVDNIAYGVDFRPHEKPIGPLETAVLVFPEDDDTAPCDMPPPIYSAPESDPA